ncbi:MAG: pilus assembly protein PilP [Thermodesulfobacteriota bacterium]
MIPRFHGIRPGICVFVLMFFLIGCVGDNAASPDKQVVRGKMPEHPATSVEMAATEEAPTSEETASAEDIRVSKKILPIDQKSLLSEEGLSPEELQKAEVLLASAEEKVESAYNSKERTDPFEPVIEESPGTGGGGGGGVGTCPEIVIGPTPLENMHLEHLKLTGIVRFANQGKAVLEDPKGKPYIISKGTKVGMNAGVVEDILEDHIIIKEKRIDQNCKITYHDEVVKLNKPNEIG